MSSITWDVLNPDAPATHLFPAFENKIYQMVEEEVAGLDANSLVMNLNSGVGVNGVYVGI